MRVERQPSCVVQINATTPLCISLARSSFRAFSWALVSTFASARAQTTLTGKAAVDADWTKDAPGVRHKITIEDLPAPNATKSVNNDARVVARPAGAQLHVPAGFKIEEFAAGFKNPRYLLTAPNGDILVAESSEDTIKILRDSHNNGRPEMNGIFSNEDALNEPFGLAFYPPGPDPQYLYVANTDGVIRFPYRNGDHQSPRTGGETERPALRRRAPPRRRTLDARSHLFSRRQKDVRLDRLAFERFR